MKRLVNTQGKHEIVIVLLIVVPLMVIGVTYAIIEGGFAVPIEPVTPVATPLPPTATPATSGFIIVDEA